MNEALRERGVRRVRHELHRRAVQVSRVESVGAGCVRVTLGGPSLAGFHSPAFDDHIKLIVNDGPTELFRRDYTPRRFDPQALELTLEIGLHAQGSASTWARGVRVGDAAIIGGPRGSMVIPMDYAWHLLAGDATALPAIARRLEELPASARGIVFVQASPDDRRPLVAPANCRTVWVDRPDELVAAVAGYALPTGEGFVWCAGESALMAELRRELIEHKGHPVWAARIAAYWRRGATGFHEDLVEPPALRVIQDRAVR